MRWTGAYPRWWVCPLKIALHQGGPILPSFQDDSCIHKKSFHSLPLRDALSFPGMWSLMLARAHSAGGYVAERKEKLQTAGVWGLVESHTSNTSSSKTHCLSVCFKFILKELFLVLFLATQATAAHAQGWLQFYLTRGMEFKS